MFRSAAHISCMISTVGIDSVDGNDSGSVLPDIIPHYHVMKTQQSPSFLSAKSIQRRREEPRLARMSRSAHVVRAFPLIARKAMQDSPGLALHVTGLPSVDLSNVSFSPDTFQQYV